MNTRGINIQWSVYNVWSDTYFISIIFIENPGNNIFDIQFKVLTAYIYNKNIPDSASIKIGIIILYVLFMINIFLFAAKLVIELSLGINKVTNMIDALNLTFQCLAVSARITSLGIVVDYEANFNVLEMSFQTFQT